MASDAYRANSHYFAGCGPSILSSIGKYKRPKKQLTVECPQEETNTIASSFIPTISDIRKPKPVLQISPVDVALDKPEPTVVFEKRVPPPPKPNKERNLSPATLGQLLSAELDHFLKVEQDIAAVAEVETNVETTRHEHRMANEVILDDDTEELEELQKLDMEIARLEAILEQKAAAYADEYEYSESYEYEYSM